MNSLAIFRSIGIIVLVVVLVIHKSNASDVTLCEEFESVNNIVYERENDKFCVGNTIKINKKEYIKLLIKNGYINSNNTVTACAQLITHGFESVNEIVVTQPTAAESAMKQVIQDAKDLFYYAGALLYYNLGAANALATESTRKGFGKAIQRIEVVGIEGINMLRNAEMLANEGIKLGGSAAKHALKSALQFIQSGFAAGSYELQLSHQEAMNAVSDAQQIRTPMKGTSAKDMYALAAISDIKKAAKNSINRGAAADKVEHLKESLINSLVVIAQISSNVRKYFTHVQTLGKPNPSSSENSFMKGAIKKIQKETANILLDLGGVGLKSDRLSRNQIAKAIAAAETGVTKMTIFHQIAGDWTLRALNTEGTSTRKLLLSAAIQRARYGTIVYYQKMVAAAKLAFNVL